MRLRQVVVAQQPTPRLPLRVLAYVAAVVLLALASSLWTSATMSGWREPSVPIAIVFGLLVAGGERLLVRLSYRQNGEALVLLEGLTAPLILCASGTRALIIVASGVVLGQVITGNDPVKRLFNVAQWVTSVCAGIVVWHALALPHDGSLPTLVGLVVTLSAVTAANQVLVTGVLWCATGHVLGFVDRTSASHILRARAFNLGVNGILGVLSTAAYLWQPWTVVVVVALLASLHHAGNAGASMRAHQLRMAALQRATHHLSAALDTAAMLPFLREMRAGFEVQDVQLMLAGNDGSLLRTYTCAGDDSFGTSTDPHPLAERLAAALSAPAHFAAGNDEIGTLLTDLGRTRLLAAPLRRGDRTVGVLLLLDRLGAGGFDNGELAVAGAVGRELVGFLDRVELVREIDEERRKLADVVDHTSDGIISIDSDGTILSWNAAFATMTGYSAEEMLDTRHLGLLRPRDVEGKDLHMSGWLDRIEAIGLPPEMQLVTVTGSTVWVSCSYSIGPDSTGGLPVLIMVARNITQARELELLKDDFVAVVSHELRTPLVPIKGWAQTLLNHGDRLSEEQRRTAVQSILSQAQRLESLVLNILECSRVEAGQAESMGVVDIAAVAQHVVGDMRLARPERTVRAAPPLAPLHVRGAGVWVEQAIANLLGNAVKYSADDEPVDVVLERLGGNVVLSVTDRGPGIPLAAWERVFARFERLEGAGKQTGTGLGLYITRRLARAMGGDVTVSSVPGAGSTFVLTLPAIGDGTPVRSGATVGDGALVDDAALLGDPALGDDAALVNGETASPMPFQRAATVLNVP